MNFYRRDITVKSLKMFHKNLRVGKKVFGDASMLKTCLNNHKVVKNLFLLNICRPNDYTTKI